MGRNGAFALLMISLLTVLTACPGLIDLSPEPSISVSTSGGQAPLTVTFRASGFAEGEDTTGDQIVEYRWDFGDGGTATGKHVTHTYTAAGTFTVTLTVTDDDGETDTATITVKVTAPQPTTTMLYWGNNGGDVMRCDVSGDLPCNPETVATAGSPVDVVFDNSNGLVYWSTQLSNTSDEIRRCDPSGSLPCTGTTVVSIGGATGVAFDSDQNILYWGDSGQDALQRCDPSGSLPCNPNDVIKNETSDSLAFEGSKRRLYWAAGEVRRCEVSSCDSPENFTDGTSNAAGLDYDGANNHIYWSAADQDEIRRCSASDSAPCSDQTVATTQSIPGDVVFDPDTNYIYWSRTVPGADIKRCDVSQGLPCSGSDIETVVENQPVPVGLALDK